MHNLSGFDSHLPLDRAEIVNFGHCNVLIYFRLHYLQVSFRLQGVIQHVVRPAKVTFILKHWYDEMSSVNIRDICNSKGGKRTH